MFKNPKVKLILALLAAFLLGGAIWPLYNVGSDMYEEYQFGRMVQEDIRYRVIDRVEANGQDFFVLSIDEGEGWVVFWALFDARLAPTFNDSTEQLNYFCTRVSEIAISLQDLYPGKQEYHIYTAYVHEVQGMEGTIHVALGSEVFMFKEEAVNALREVISCGDCVIAAFNQLFEEQSFYYMNLLYYGAIPMSEPLIDRGPDYVYPWE